mmetsp:Transcript_13751/g.20831  ORF Transcript_13751/g.20831 Transcript_13751/m.20831 type:complete len:424 (-) Transcript_13751:964-2235(-)
MRCNLFFVICMLLVAWHLQMIWCLGEASQETCDSTKYSMKVFDNCEKNSDCKVYMRCSNGTCVDAVDGSHCNFDHDCLQKGYFCLENRCTYRSYAGEGCKKNSECYSNHCNLRTRQCDGLPLKASCNATNPVECAKGHYCSTKTQTCVAQQKKGDACYVDPNQKMPGSNWNVACAAGTLCLSNVCREVHTKKSKEVSSSKYDCAMSTHYKGGLCIHNMNPHEGAKVVCPDGSTADYTEHCVCQEDGQKSVRPVISTQCISQDVSKLYDELTEYHTKCWKENNCPYSEFEDSLTYLEFNIPNNRSCMSKCAKSSKYLMCCLQFDTNVYSDPYAKSYIPFRYRAECVATLLSISPNMNVIFTRILFLVSVTSAVTMIVCLAFVFLIQRGTRLANAARLRQLQQQQEEADQQQFQQQQDDDSEATS